MLFSARTYDDPARAGDKYYIPSMLIQSEDGNEWSVVCCMPGCMPEGDPVTFTTPTKAVAYAYEGQDDGEDTPDFVKAFHFAYCGSLNRLRGSIALALADEAQFAAMYSEAERNGDTDGLDHVEELAHEAARCVHSVKG
jgi:hypothetical protein